jgi:1-phosphatidylinositol-3-phosphate 5-kinase
LQQYPLYLTEEAKRLLTVAIHNDTVFLTKNNVMDYSLLVAVDESSNKLIVGIIDYIRQYTMDKQVVERDRDRNRDSDRDRDRDRQTERERERERERESP